MKRAKKHNKLLITVGLILLILATTCGGVASRYYFTFYRPNICHTEAPIYIYVPHDATFNTLMDSIDAQQCLRNRNAFVRAAHKEQLPERLKGGGTNSNLG